VALAAALNAAVCEIYTDVDGVYTTDPRLVPEARKLDTISYDEMLEMASLGAGVMHGRSIELGKKFNVPIHVRSSFIDTPGTMIMNETGMEAVVVRGATLKRAVTSVTLAHLPNQPGLTAGIFDEVAARGIPVDDIVQTVSGGGQDCTLSFTVENREPGEMRRSRSCSGSASARTRWTWTRTWPA